MNEKFILFLAKYVKTTFTGGPPRYLFCTHDTAIISDQSAANSTNGISCQIHTSLNLKFEVFQRFTRDKQFSFIIW